MVLQAIDLGRSKDVERGDLCPQVTCYLDNLIKSRVSCRLAHHHAHYVHIVLGIRLSENRLLFSLWQRENRF